jgi:hypothetical protein
LLTSAPGLPAALLVALAGPGYEPTGGDLEHLVSVYGPPGAFTASIAWYRAGAGSVAATRARRIARTVRSLHDGQPAR